MTERVDVLMQRVTELLRAHKAAKAEVMRLTKALQRAEVSRDKAVREAEAAKRDALHHTLTALPIPDDAKPALRRSLDAVITEIDDILMQLHD